MSVFTVEFYFLNVTFFSNFFITPLFLPNILLFLVIFASFLSWFVHFGSYSLVSIKI